MEKPESLGTWDFPRIIHLKTRVDTRGSLNVADGLPFSARRAFWIYCVPEGEQRGGHAHAVCQQFMVALRGGVAVEIRGNDLRHRYVLDRPNKGLYVPVMYEVTMRMFSEDCLLLVLASHEYDPNDYLFIPIP